MNSRRKTIQWLKVLILIAALLALFGLYMTLFSGQRWKHIQIHSSIEAIGGIIALFIAFVLLLENRKEDGIVFWVGTGFACMGVLDTFHAMSPAGDAFIFLHSVASLAGGFFFMMVWLPQEVSARYATEQRWIFGVAVILSLSVGLRALLFPESVPKILYFHDGRFTLAAVIINTTASLFFLFSVPRFYFHYQKVEEKQYISFMYLSLLFGLAEMVFQFSDPWDGVWWAWHILRLTAYIMMLIYAASRYLDLIRQLRITSEKQAENE